MQFEYEVKQLKLDNCREEYALLFSSLYLRLNMSKIILERLSVLENFCFIHLFESINDCDKRFNI